AADHKAARVEDAGQRGQALAQPAAHDLETAQRDRVSLVRGLGYLGAADAVHAAAAELEQPHRGVRRAPGELPGLGDQGVAARVLLPAAAVAAPAQPPVRHDAVVAGLAGDAPAAPVQLTVDHDPGADTRADGDEHDVILPAGRAEDGLGPDGRV